MKNFSEEELKGISESISLLIKNGQLIVLISNATDEGSTEIIPIIKDKSPVVNGSAIQIDLSDQCMGTPI
tara:strand:- start:857 stop:1066 length:210 start_codon:yes stop_codon:yes gene_type:complete